MPDEMFFSKDEKSLIRGSRQDARTETCRPCTVALTDDDAIELHGVVLDVTPRSMLVRMMEAIPLSTSVTIQLMRDDKYQQELSSPHNGAVRRIESTEDGFYDHGVEIHRAPIKKASERPVYIAQSKPTRPTEPSRMQTVDHTLENLKRKLGR
jgi:hypothetical protein